MGIHWVHSSIVFSVLLKISFTWASIETEKSNFVPYLSHEWEKLCSFLRNASSKLKICVCSLLSASLKINSAFSSIPEFHFLLSHKIFLFVVIKHNFCKNIQAKFRLLKKCQVILHSPVFQSNVPHLIFTFFPFQGDNGSF